MHARDLEVVVRNGVPFCVEKDPITLHQTSSDPDSPLVHKRYAPEGSIDLTFRGRRIDGGVDILLPEPIELDGVQYGMLRRLGVGQDANQPFAIGFGMRWAFSEISGGSWQETGPEDLKKHWGVLTQRQADSIQKGRSGASALVYTLAPRHGNARLSFTEYDSARFGELRQPSFLLTTNIGLDEIGKLSQLGESDALSGISVAQLAQIDARMVLEQISLIQQGRILLGDVTGGRLVDGRIIYVDEAREVRYDLDMDSGRAVSDHVTYLVIEAAKSLPKMLSRRYLSELGSLTGLPFGSMGLRRQDSDPIVDHLYDTREARASAGFTVYAAPAKA